MKKSLLLSLVFLNVLISCQKDAAPDPVPTYSAPPLSLQNAWELRNVVGGYGPPNRNPNYAAGNGYIWKFMDSTFERYDKGQLFQTGKYRVIRDTSYQTGRMMDALVFDQNAYPKVQVEIVKDTLIMYLGVVAADGTISRYVRIGDTH
ncbi:MAG: hypothetical protein V4539_03850 [Bacteroidota bacterium]